jgi:transcriptional regulator with XRE-family HTH domain
MSSSEIIGTRVRNFRELLGMSMEDLAKNAGVDIAMVRNIENGNAYPPIGVMIRLARALGQRLGTFLDDQYTDDPLVVRKNERVEETASQPGGAAGHYHYYSLGKGKTDRHMEPFFIVIEPSNEKVLSSHEGEELVIVISGQVELAYGKKNIILDAGDSMYYNSIVPHNVWASGGASAEIYAVIYMPF